MTIHQMIQPLEQLAPRMLQESYDNSGLLIGNRLQKCTGVICCLDVTEAVLKEAVKNKANLIVAHHPIIFSGLKKITGANFVEKIVIEAIKNDIAIYAIHTSLDNIINGVNARIADKIGLISRTIVAPKQKMLKKLYTYIPAQNADLLKTALFAIGVGRIANYYECSFAVVGEGTFKGNANSKPVVGKKNIRSTETEVKIEFLFPAWLENEVIKQLKLNHPYEEVAYEVISLDNQHQEIGSGIIGELPKSMTEKAFLTLLQKAFKAKSIRHSALLSKKINKVAICGGSGSFLISNALAMQADVFVTADVKYHDFFEANNQLLIADIGHYESEQFTIDLIYEHLRQNFPTFAIQKTKINTNSIYYFG